MIISIEYCITCNYGPIAAGLAMAIERSTGLKSVLVPSHLSGAFEVMVDGEAVFSKRNAGIFPEHSEIIEAISRKTRGL